MLIDCVSKTSTFMGQPAHSFLKKMHEIITAEAVDTVFLCVYFYAYEDV